MPVVRPTYWNLWGLELSLAPSASQWTGAAPGFQDSLTSRPQPLWLHQHHNLAWFPPQHTFPSFPGHKSLDPWHPVVGIAPWVVLSPCSSSSDPSHTSRHLFHHALESTQGVPRQVLPVSCMFPKVVPSILSWLQGKGSSPGSLRPLASPSLSEQSKATWDLRGGGETETDDSAWQGPFGHNTAISSQGRVEKGQQDAQMVTYTREREE